MENVIVKNIDELGYYQGEGAIEGIKFRYAGKDLGVTAWGMNVIELEPHCEKYPEHDHVADGQEEVYVVLEGAATLVVGEEKTVLGQHMMVRVAPGVKRKFVTEDIGAILLAIGNTPGKPYPIKN